MKPITNNSVGVKLRNKAKALVKQYTHWFQLYNLAYDLNTLDPKAADIYWEEDKEDFRNSQLAYKINTDYIEETKDRNLYEEVGFTGFTGDY